jgi:protein-L-isoaspartate(D-aspartate) O-methyltransferase
VTDAEHKIRLLMELRSQGITDTQVLAAIERIPRERFVPDFFKPQAYENIALPIGSGQTISQPYVVALMTQALDLGERVKVLEIGTGSGYQAAILSRLARRVYTIDRHRALVREAENLFAELRISNITTRVGDGSKGWPEQAPFPRIIVTAAAPTVPETLADQLAPGGILIIPVGREGEDQEVLRIHRDEDGFTEQHLTPVRFVPLLPGIGEG